MLDKRLGRASIKQVPVDEMAWMLDQYGRIRSGRSPDWLKSKNPACEVVRREAEEDWGR